MLVCGVPGPSCTPNAADFVKRFSRAPMQNVKLIVTCFSDFVTPAPAFATFCLLAAVVQVESLTAKLAQSDSQLQQAVKTTLAQVSLQCKDQQSQFATTLFVKALEAYHRCKVVASPKDLHEACASVTRSCCISIIAWQTRMLIRVHS